ncbi:uncharacterized protein DUF1292 [Anaerobacterium chartisolvens]|uniref:UPF0473 protein DFR58_105172 n=2 Tax=Anaerobacterium chartisolvens TaxID=1297424 RepID=A0A369BCS9_9FIRM|nr:uncharacterized protein DUF1292 [Anaerobacterium chartisolvens]
MIDVLEQEEYTMAEERDDIVILVDDNGDEAEFEHLDTIEINESEYVILIPLSENEDEDMEEEEVVILKIEHGEDGEDSFVSVENEEELNAVFEEFKLRMEDEYEFEDDE